MTRFALAALAAIALTGCAAPLDRPFVLYAGKTQVRVVNHWQLGDSSIKRLTDQGWRLAATHGDIAVIIKE